MKLDLDPDWLRTSMNMWRDAVDMKIPVHNNFKIHFLERRVPLLEGFVKTLDACAFPEANGQAAAHGTADLAASPELADYLREPDGAEIGFCPNKGARLRRSALLVGDQIAKV